MARGLLLIPHGDEAERVAAICRQAFGQVEAFHGNWGDPLPGALADWQGDLILSYCSRWIVPQWLLDRAPLSLNFHPAPPEHPGIGGLNWALYHGDTSFGVTCHHMTRKVDAGPIVDVRRFPILPEDDAPALFHRTHHQLEAMARSVIRRLAKGWDAPAGSHEWAPVARLRRELDAMMDVPRGTGCGEVERRRRAFEFGRWKLLERA